MTEAIADRRRARLRVEQAGRRAVTTPGRLRRLSVAIAVAAIALAVIGAGTLAAAAATVSGIQQSTVPAIVGMEHIHAWLSDADRSAASAYLAGGSQNAPSQLQYDANIAGTNLDVLGRLNAEDPQIRYEADIAAASRELQRATQPNLGGSAASQRLQAIAAAVGNYTRLVQTASINETQDPAAGTVYLQAASNLMHGQGGILGQVDGMRDFYATSLDQANLTLQITAGMLGVYTAVAIVVLALLVSTQRFIRARFRRRRNNRLLAATLLLMIVSVGGGVGAVQAAQGVRDGEDQSYARLQNLWIARALTYDAHANQSLSLIARNGSAEFDQAFQVDTARLVDRPLTDQLVQDAGRGQVRFNGLLADELRRSTSTAETGSALNIIRAYQAFLQAEAAVRANAPPVSGRAAATAASAAAEDKLASAFAELDWYLGVSILNLQTEFDAAMGAAELILIATASLQVLALAIAGLTFWGLQPRMNEYTAGSKRQ
jgi:hypothetical protein